MPISIAEWRLGLVVPKRYERHAVRRNAIKRVWREAFRQARPGFEEGLQTYDLVVRLLRSMSSGTPALSLKDLKRLCRDDAERLLQQMRARIRAIPANE